MTEAHTPGPWKSVAAGTFDSGEEIFNVKAGPHTVAEFAFRDDATLIAAAPDLLDALREIADGCERRLRKGSDSGDKATLQIARFAIAKATGCAQ